MAKRNTNTVEAPRSTSSNAGRSSWSTAKGPVRLPSGKPLPFSETEQNAMLQFLGVKDISSKVVNRETGEMCEAGEVVYFVFNDGKRIVTMPEGAALRDLRQGEEPLEAGQIIFIELVDFVETKQPTPMRDFFIATVGNLGDLVDVPEDMQKLLADVMEGGKLNLSLKNLAVINYQKLNYPLRVV